MLSFDHSLPMILHRALDAVMGPYRDIFSDFNLTEQQWRVLRVLWGSKKVTSIELSRRTLLSAPSLVGILDRLEKKGLLTRVRSESDRRSVYIIATREGRALEQDVTPHIAKIHTHLRASVSDDEWIQMERTLQKIGKSIDDIPLKKAANR